MNFISVVMMLFILIMPNASLAFSQADQSRDNREVAMGENAILSSLIVYASHSGRYVCSKQPIFCIGPNGAELGLALIASKNSNSALDSLASLIRFRIDAGLSEDYTCYVLSKGKRIVSHLVSMKRKGITSQCESEVSILKKTHSGLIDDVADRAVCADPYSIAEKTQSLIEAIKDGRHCSREDF